MTTSLLYVDIYRGQLDWKLRDIIRWKPIKLCDVFPIIVSQKMDESPNPCPCHCKALSENKNACLYYQDEATESGRQVPFFALRIPFCSLEEVISQCRDFNKASTSPMVLDSSRTINLPPGLAILSTSAITATSLHLRSQNNRTGSMWCTFSFLTFWGKKG